jgi:hypothetical protein
MGGGGGRRVNTVKKSFKRKDKWVDGSVVLISYREEGKKEKKRKRKRKRKRYNPTFLWPYYIFESLWVSIEQLSFCITQHTKITSQNKKRTFSNKSTTKNEVEVESEQQICYPNNELLSSKISFENDF